VLSDPFPLQRNATDFREHAVPILGYALLLATVSVASFPCWRHSRRWGYVPCASTAILLFFVALAAVGGKPATGNARMATAPASAPASSTVPHDYILDSSRQPIPLPRHALEPVNVAASADATSR